MKIPRGSVFSRPWVKPIKRRIVKVLALGAKVSMPSARTTLSLPTRWPLFGNCNVYAHRYIIVSMPRHSKVPHRNRSPSGWWIFREVEQWVSKRQKALSANSRCPVWENTRLIRAKNRKEAYRKAFKLGRAGFPSKTNGGEWRFAGISMLLPVYEDIADGAEILWEDRGSLPVKRIRKLVKSKRHLPVFNDKAD